MILNNLTLRTRSIIYGVLMPALLAITPVVHASKTAMGSTGCTWYENDEGAIKNSSLTGAQCPFSSTLDGSGTDNGPIPLVTSTGLLADLNTWLADNNKGVSIQSGSLVAIETIGGPGRNGNSCGTCSSGKGANAGYAISIQNLGGMQQLIGNSPIQLNYQALPLALFVYVGDKGKSANTDKGGGGGAASIVIGGQNLGNISQNYVLFPSAETNASSNIQKIDNMVFAIGAGGGAGGGSRGTSGHHGGHGGQMTGAGPNTTQDEQARVKTAVVVATKAMAVVETQLVRVEHRVVFRVVFRVSAAWALLLSESLLNGHMDKEDQLEGDKVLAAPVAALRTLTMV